MASAVSDQPWILQQPVSWFRPKCAAFTPAVSQQIANDEDSLQRRTGVRIDAAQGFFYGAKDQQTLDGVCVGHDRAGHAVAVKVRCGRKVQLGLKEGRLLRTLTHPHIVACLDVFLSPTQHLYLVTPWAYYGVSGKLFRGS